MKPNHRNVWITNFETMNPPSVTCPAAIGRNRPLVYYTDQWSIAQARLSTSGRERSRRAQGFAMPRVIKHPELRREELLNHAQALFLTHGYDKASLNDVIAAAGISKGAFYHYFPSKEALLEALAERFAKQALSGVQDILADPALDPLGRLNALLAKSRQAKIETAAEAWALFDTLFRPENLVLFHRINLAASASFSPLLVEIIRQGVEEGTFRTFDPEGVADIVMQFGMATHDVIAKAFAGGSDADR